MEFKDPWILLFIPLVMIWVFWVRRRQLPPALRFSSTDLGVSLKRTWKTRYHYFPQLLKLIALGGLLVALAGPRSVLEETQIKKEGIDIVLVIDVSGSMAAEDFTINRKRVNRLDVVKQVLEEFIEKRTNDRMGLIAFARQAFTVCPLTTDHSWLKTNLKRITIGLIDEQATAIGSGLTSSLARLRSTQAKSKIVILLTDGVHNAGRIDPITAAQMAKNYGIKIYTIGAGSRGYAPVPVYIGGRKFYQREPVEIDEETLEKIAAVTDGRYYRATNTESLRQIYEEIDALERTEIEEIGYKDFKELFPYWVSAAWGLLLGGWFLSETVFFKIP